MEHEAPELARELQNPVAALISVPIEDNWDFGAGPATIVPLISAESPERGGDSGSGARLGDFKSRVYGIGPQVGFLFSLGGRQTYLNIKGYHEFDAKNRLEGWNTWLTLVLPLDGSQVRLEKF